MEKEESSGEKVEGLPKQEVSGIHGDQCMSAAARPALPPRAAGLVPSALLQGTGEPALLVTLLCASFAVPCTGSAPLCLHCLCLLEHSFCCCLSVSCGPGQHLPGGELKGIEGWGWPAVLALALGFRTRVGP